MKSFLPNLLLALLFTLMPLQAYEQAFPKTSPGEVEVKTLPPALVIESRTERPYFDNNGELFMKLFRYIDAEDIPMTIPVESSIEQKTMRFYIDSKSSLRDDLPSNEQTQLIALSERTVLAAGIRGSYNASNYQEALQNAKTWLLGQETYEAAGEPVMIYWNGPMRPGPFKTSEVHIPVRKVAEN